MPNVAVSLRANSSVRDPNPHNLIVAILDGLPEHDFPGLARMQDMPGFAADLDDAEVAALATWLRQQFGGQSASWTPSRCVNCDANPRCADYLSRSFRNGMLRSRTPVAAKTAFAIAGPMTPTPASPALA